jgi:hypothetical protein
MCSICVFSKVFKNLVANSQNFAIKKAASARLMQLQIEIISITTFNILSKHVLHQSFHQKNTLAET